MSDDQENVQEPENLPPKPRPPSKVTLEEAKQQLEEFFGYSNFKNEIQERAVMAILNGNPCDSDSKDSKSLIFRRSQQLHKHAHWLWKITMFPTANFVSGEQIVYCL